MNSITRITLQVLLTLVSGIAGMLIGALYGGNYATNFVFMGVRGYEATGQLGMILGLVLGAGLSIRYLHKQQ
jgi:hypothetical protein